MREMSKKKVQPQDFITSEPEPVIMTNEEQMKLINENIEIIGALGRKQFMTVKQIHHLFLEDPEGPVYSKGLKTIYRHLDILDKAGLVKIAGHRKYQGSRQTEKLYCRTGKVFFQEREVKGSKWWETEQGQQELAKLSDLALMFFEVSQERREDFKKHMSKYLESWSQVVRELFEKAIENEELATIFGDVDVFSIKDMARTIGMIGVLLEEPEIFKNLADTMKK